MASATLIVESISKWRRYYHLRCSQTTVTENISPWAERYTT